MQDDGMISWECELNNIALTIKLVLPEATNPDERKRLMEVIIENIRQLQIKLLCQKTPSYRRLMRRAFQIKQAVRMLLNSEIERRVADKYKTEAGLSELCSRE